MLDPKPVLAHGQICGGSQTEGRRLRPICRAMDAEMEAVAPGQALGEGEQLRAGRGAYSEQGQTFASLAGQLRFSENCVEVGG